MTIAEFLTNLAARLPELEWKLSTVELALIASALPPGLFKTHSARHPGEYIAEIKADLKQLGRQQSLHSAYYLAQRVQQKIKILVNLCQQNPKKTNSPMTLDYKVRTISTRQQWLHQLHQELEALTAQQQALQNALLRLQACQASNAILTVQQELAEVKARLKLASATLADRK